jgi:hypothetical protein
MTSLVPSHLSVVSRFLLVTLFVFHISRFLHVTNLGTQEHRYALY